MLVPNTYGWDILAAAVMRRHQEAHSGHLGSPEGSTLGNHLLLRVKQGGRVVWNPKSLPEIEVVTVIFTQNRNSDSNMRGREGAFHKGLP